METRPMLTTAVYLRCSSSTQTTDSQRFELEQYVSNQVICGPVEWYEDSAVSGKSLDRPALGRLHRDIIDGRVDSVVLWKLDRLSRSIVDGVKLLADWTARDIRIAVVTQKIDLSGPVGRMVASLLLGVAEIEKEGMRERQAAGIAAARAKGVRFGRPKAVDASMVRRLRSEGHAVQEIARELKVARQTVYNALAQ
jgi:DNA invertase Pin-like site-specific DNA recombinase